MLQEAPRDSTSLSETLLVETPTAHPHNTPAQHCLLAEKSPQVPAGWPLLPPRIELARQNTLLWGWVRAEPCSSIPCKSHQSILRPINSLSHPFILYPIHPSHTPSILYLIHPSHAHPICSVVHPSTLCPIYPSIPEPIRSSWCPSILLSCTHHSVPHPSHACPINPIAYPPIHHTPHPSSIPPIHPLPLLSAGPSRAVRSTCKITSTVPGSIVY